ncbi:MAG TPA: DNA translocase FtsK 4TM domain-containing protein [Bacteroidales bacterium]|nr:DNA translocase FtsK 4TM domain-containing protein [Bacteroidales bacterium]
MANQILKNKEVVKKNKKKKGKKTVANKKTNKSSFIDFLKNRKFHLVLGIFLFLFTIFLFCSFISFFGSHEADDSIFKTNFFETLSTNGTPKNSLGILGLYFSFLFIKDSFGIASFGFLWLFFLWSIYLIRKKHLFSPFKMLTVITISIIWFSLVLGAIFGKSETLSWLGGDIGNQLSATLIESSIGLIGFILLITFIGLTTLIVFAGFNFNFMIPKETEEVDEDEEVNPVIESNAVIPSENNQKGQKKKSVFSFFHREKDKSQENVKTIPEIANETEDEDFEEEVAQTKPIEEEIMIHELVQNQPNVSIDERETLPGDDIIFNDEEEGMEIIIEETIDDLETEIGTSEPVELEPYDPYAELSQYQFPPVELLEEYTNTIRTLEEKEAEIRSNKIRIQDTLSNYGVQIQSISAIEGPTITLYEIVPAPGVRISKIKNLEDDIALSLSALGIRIIAPMPGKGTIGIEVPNSVPKIVPMRSTVQSEKFQHASKMILPIAIGKTISNEVFVFDLAKMPHVLMAGATGQGKSVGLNAVLVSLLYKKHPAELKLVLVDPKKVELTLYSKIERHYLAKLPDLEEAIITDTKKVVRTLNSLCIEMDLRYDLLKEAQCRNIVEYNEKFKSRRLNPEKGHRFLPYIVLIFDEFADCIMTAGREIESPIARLAQLARAIGIHLIIATQRPSVNIITGIIKANFPARIAFKVSSKIDSRTILDSGGAERLIGKGDMLISTGNDIIRLQCALVDTPEVEKICDFIGEQHGFTSALHLPEVPDEQEDNSQEADDGDIDSMFADAAYVVVNSGHGSTSLLQRKLKLGYNRAGRIMDQLERVGIVGPFEGSKAREVRIKDPMTLEEKLKEMGLS